jgi:hypothetical protein
MRYDFYNREKIYKPRFAIKARDRLHRKILSDLNIKSVCEIGVGFGEFADYCQRHNINYVGIESNDNLRNALTSKGVKIYNALMPNFPQIQEKFDAIFAAHFIEHLNGLQEVLKFLDYAKEALNSHGGEYLILIYPDIEKCGNLFWHDYTHNFVTTKKRVEDLLFDSGWEIIRSERYTGCFFRFPGLISLIGKYFPYFLLPEKVAWFLKLSFLQHVVTIGKPVK